MRLPLALLLGLAIPALAALAQPHTSDLKISTQFTTGRQPPFTTTQYIKGARSRIERDFAGHPRVTINLCDLHQVLQLDPEARQYTSYTLDDQGRAEGSRTPAKTEPSGNVVVINIENTDTGERKNLFGYTARHVIEKETRTPSPGANAVAEEYERDGWYIDLDFNAGCAPKPKGARYFVKAGTISPAGGTVKLDKIEVHQKGASETGFAVWLATKQSVPRPNNAAPFVRDTVQEVVELSSAPLDPALFELPAGYKKVDRLQDYIARGPAARGAPPESTWGALKRYWASLFR